MDARSLSKATGVQAGTFNAWIQRGLVAGVDVQVSGRRRDFDLKTATHVAIMAELVRFGFGAPLAATTAALALSDSGQRCFLIARPVQVGPIDKVGQKFGASFVHFKSEADLPTVLQDAEPDVPGVYMIINTERIAAKIQRAEEEWQRQRAALKER